MTERCVHCVYSKKISDRNINMYCMLKHKIVGCMQNHCDDLISRPIELISFFLKHTNRVDDWNEAYRIASKYFEEYGFAGMTISKLNKLYESE